MRPRRDTQIKQGTNGKNWHFSMKAHVGTDPHGVVHTLITMRADAGAMQRLRGDLATRPGRRETAAPRQLAI